MLPKGREHVVNVQDRDGSDFRLGLQLFQHREEWLKSLERVLETIEEYAHPDFRPRT